MFLSSRYNMYSSSLPHPSCRRPLTFFSVALKDCCFYIFQSLFHSFDWNLQDDHRMTKWYWSTISSAFHQVLETHFPCSGITFFITRNLLNSFFKKHFFSLAPNTFLYFSSRFFVASGSRGKFLSSRLHICHSLEICLEKCCELHFVFANAGIPFC